MSKRGLLITTGLFVGIFGPAISATSILDDNGRRVNLKARNLPLRHDECSLCHTRKSKAFISTKTKTKLEHEGKLSMHGRSEMACQHCHDINNYNYLLSNGAFVSSWENSSGVCQRCHADRYRDWKAGMHGKRIGSWNRSMTQFHCIDCHDPHSVKFKSMQADPISKPSRFRIHKQHDINQDLPSGEFTP